MPAGGAGAHHRHVRPADAVLDGDLAGRGVRQHVRQHEGGHAPWPALVERLLALDQDADAADAGSEDHAEAIGVEVAVDPPVLAEQPGVAQGLAAGRHREVRVAVVASHVLGIHVGRCVESLHLARDVDLERGGVEEGDVGDAGTAGDEGVPGGIRADPDRRHDAQAGRDRASRGHAGISRRVARKERSLGPSATCVSASGLMRRMRPVSTRPGPTSTKSVTPPLTRRRTVPVHCTPCTRCSLSSLRSPSAVLMTVACTLPSIGTLGSRKGTFVRILPNSSRARRISGEWRATLTVSLAALRAPTVVLISSAKTRAGMTPERTIGPRALALATLISPCCRASSTISWACSSDRPMTAPMPPSMPRACMIRPRSRTRRSASA